MAATLQEFLDTGGTDGNPANATVVDALGPPRLKFKTADNATVDTNHPIPKPAAGTNYSFLKNVYLECSAEPTMQCDNFKWYTDGGGFGAGISLQIGTQTPTKRHDDNSGYGLATGTVGETGIEMVTEHPGVTGKADAFGFTSAAPKSVSCSEVGNVITTVGDTTHYIILQMEVTNAASAGTPSNETVTWKWDEL